MPLQKKGSGEPLIEPGKVALIRYCEELKGDKPELSKNLNFDNLVFYKVFTLTGDF
jgi:hypothetical protein